MAKIMYDFICNKCGDERQELVSSLLRDAVLIRCEKCDCFMERVKWAKPNIILSGPGFYSTDNPKGCRR